MRFPASFFIALVCLAVLSACGNTNDGNPFRSKKSSVTVNPIKAGAQSPLGLLYCKQFTVIDGGNASFAASFSGSSICKVDSSYPMVQLKVGMNFPQNGRFCLVPMSDYAFPETCFSPTDAMTFTLDASAAQFGSIVILAESDLNAYKAFLNYASNYAPPRAIAVMNQ